MTEEQPSMYQNGKIYKIVDNGYNLCYYGSTVQPLSKRLASHKKDYVRYKGGKKPRPLTVHQIFDEYGFENCKIESVELFPCNIKAELHKREGEIIKNNECVNKFIPGRTHSENQKDNRDKATERVRKFRAKLTDEAKQTTLQKAHDYCNTNKERIIEYQKSRYTCEVCSESVRVGNKAKHERTKKHIGNLNSLINS